MVTMSGYKNSWRPMGKYCRWAARIGTLKGTDAKLAARFMLKLASPTPICREATFTLLCCGGILVHCITRYMLHAHRSCGMSKVQIFGEWKSSCHLCAELANPQDSIACFGSRLPH